MESCKVMESVRGESRKKQRKEVKITVMTLTWNGDGKKSWIL